MDTEKIYSYCDSKKGSIRTFPFDDVTLVYKVGNKMFALLAIDESPLRINLKCDPDLALNLRSQYKSISPGYHMNKKHWNTVLIDGSIATDEIFKMIDHSYELVLNSLAKKERTAINDQSESDER